MKRILIFSLNYYPFVGGAEIAIKEITDRIRPEDIEFHLIAPRYDSALPRKERMGNVMVYRIGLARPHPSIADLKRWPLNLNKKLFQVLAWIKAEQLHSRFRYDAIWAMIAHSSAIPAGLFKASHPRVPYLLTLQEGDPPEYIEQLMKPVWSLFRQGFVRADGLQAISSFLLAWGKRMGFAGTGLVIPNGVDTKHFSHVFSQEQVRDMKDRLGKKEGDVFLVTTSRLYPKNAIDDVIRALAELPRNISFIIYGIGPEEAALRNIANECEVSERVRFMGQISHEEMPLALSACDIFVRPSRSEGMGNSFIEAMAAGLPVIATQEGGIADFLFDSERNPDQAPTGWAVDADSPEQITRAVKDILAHCDETQKVVENARELVQKRYDWDRIAHEMREDVFRGILGI